MDSILNWIDRLLISMGLSQQVTADWDNYLAVLIALLLSMLVTWIANRYVVPLLCKAVAHTDTKWDDILFNEKVLRSLCRLLPPLILYIVVPLLSRNEGLPVWVDMACRIYLAVAFTLLGNTMINTMYTIWNSFEGLRDKPIKGLLQVVKLLIYIIAAIFIISILLGYSPFRLLTGLGASAAIVTLIFKDTIVGFISGIQLSAHDMVRKGDWITVEKHGINGTVEEITLNTVKVRNFDETTLTIPPHLLVNEPFQNWRSMSEGGARRIVRILMIDIRSIHLLSLEEIRRLPAYPLIADLPELQPEGASLRPVPDRVVNLTLLRHYLQKFLSSLPSVRTEDRHFIVRENPHSSQGVPLEIMLFVRETRWAIYEDLLSDMMETVMALIPQFGLRLYQQPSSFDLDSMTQALTSVSTQVPTSTTTR